MTGSNPKATHACPPFEVHWSNFHPFQPTSVRSGSGTSSASNNARGTASLPSASPPAAKPQRLPLVRTPSPSTPRIRPAARRPLLRAAARIDLLTCQVSFSQLLSPFELCSAVLSFTQDLSSSLGASSACCVQGGAWFFFLQGGVRSRCFQGCHHLPSWLLPLATPVLGPCSSTSHPPAPPGLACSPTSSISLPPMARWPRSCHPGGLSFPFFSCLALGVSHQSFRRATTSQANIRCVQFDSFCSLNCAASVELSPGNPPVGFRRTGPPQGLLKRACWVLHPPLGSTGPLPSSRRRPHFASNGHG